MYRRFLELSAASVRRVMPEVQICLVSETERKLPGIDREIVIPPQYEDMKAQSRHLKTMIPQLLDTPYWNLDVDVILMRRLRAFSRFAAVPNWDSVPMTISRLWANFPRLSIVPRNGREVLGKRLSGLFLNSGVYFNPDRSLRDWNRCWTEHFRATGKAEDQPTFNYVLSGQKVKRLPWRYNLPVPVNPMRGFPWLSLPVCYHYYASENRKEPLVDMLRSEKPIAEILDWVYANPQELNFRKLVFFKYLIRDIGRVWNKDPW